MLCPVNKDYLLPRRNISKCQMYPLKVELDIESPRSSPFDEIIGMDCPEFEDPP